MKPQEALGHFLTAVGSLDFGFLGEINASKSCRLFFAGVAKISRGLGGLKDSRAESSAEAAPTS